MSKIQDALNRIQKSGRPVGSKKPGAEVETIARVVKRTADDDYHGKIIEVDMDLLREAGLLAPEAQARMLADQYRVIKRPILDNAFGKPADASTLANLVMIGSALPGDGKTFNCINLALSMASEKDTTVLLVDADVAKPHVSRLLGIQQEPGLIDALLDETLDIGDLILRTNIPRLRVLPAGQVNAEATELLASRRMEDITKQLSRRYADRMVVFDSPPLLATSEARVLASLMGQIALVVCAGKTPRNAVTEAVDSIDPDKPVNLILNRSSTAGLSSDTYGYGYGYGYQYGADSA